MDCRLRPRALPVSAVSTSINVYILCATPSANNNLVKQNLNSTCPPRPVPLTVPQDHFPPAPAVRPSVPAAPGVEKTGQPRGLPTRPVYPSGAARLRSTQQTHRVGVAFPACACVCLCVLVCARIRTDSDGQAVASDACWGTRTSFPRKDPWAVALVRPPSSHSAHGGTERAPTRAHRTVAR
jgi:hypothetical protein